jgi:hypothetical protein
MGKRPTSAQNGEVPSDAAVRRDQAAPGRQRPEEILAHTLSAPPHPEVTDGWSARGRHIFLAAMAVAGVVLVVAGLLVTKQLAPGTGRPAPVQTGPGNGLAGQLLQTSEGDQSASPPGSTPLALPLPSTPTTRPAKASAASPNPVTTAGPSALPTPTPQQQTTATTPAPLAPTTTLPCTGLLGQTVQQIQLPCRAASSSNSNLPLG